jgi:protein arginine kinase activator
MICPNCGKNEVTVHYTEIIDGKMVEYHLCEECAREKGFALTPSDAMAELISSLAAVHHPAEDEGLSCPHCGLTLKELRSGGRLGCGECYRTFAANLAPLLKALHKGVRHTGKMPLAEKKVTPDIAPTGPARSGKERQEKITRLKREVEKAVAVEDYEKAARLRDRIASLSAGENPGEQSQ